MRANTTILAPLSGNRTPKKIDGKKDRSPAQSKNTNPELRDVRREQSYEASSQSETKASTKVAALDYKIWNQDAINWLKKIPDNFVDLVITDPPYESIEKHRAVGTTTRLKNSKSSSNCWFNFLPNSKLQELMHHFFRVLKKDSHLYVFCDQETAFFLKPIGEEVGFKFWKPLIWDKQKIGMGYHYRGRYEMILFFEKGKRKLKSLSTPDVLSFPRIHRGYPTEKPEELARVLIEQSSDIGDIICDPFFGSGSFGIASLKSGRKFIGTDTSAVAKISFLKKIQDLLEKIKHKKHQRETVHAFNS